MRTMIAARRPVHWVTYTFRILSWSVAVMWARDLQAQSESRQRLSALADSLILPVVRANRLAGATVLVVHAKDTLLSRAYGQADVELGTPMPSNAVYQIGSLTKQFTAAAVLQLAERGKLRLDEDIRTYLPAYRIQGAKITVRQLLNHTSGLFDYVSLNGVRRRWGAPIAADTLAATIATHPLNFQPGSAMSYSNSGYFLLGRIVERVSGMPYAVYIETKILKPAGLTSAVYCDASRLVPNRVRGYDADEQGLENAQVVDVSWLTSTGALCASARDLARWTTALAAGTIISRHAYTTMTTPGALSDGFPLRYAAGLEVDSLLGHRAVHHGGDLPGYTSELTYLPDDTITVVVLLNTQGPLRADALTLDLLRVVLPAAKSDTVPQALPESVCRMRSAEDAGTYVGTRPYQERTATRTFRVSTEPTGCDLILRIDSGAPLRLRYRGPDDFERADNRFVFRRVRGAVVGLYADNVTDVVYAARSH